MKYDAVLTNWWEVTMFGITVVTGTISGDTKGRFADGDRIRTSYVVNLDRETGLLQTRNTTYKLENEYVPTAG